MSSICPLCGGAGSGPMGPEPGLFHCASCGIASLSPFPGASEAAQGYQEDYYEEGTGSRFLGLAERAVLALRGTRVRAIRRRCPGPGALLDLGCGRGELLELFQRRGWQVLGTQLSRTAMAAAKALRGVDVRLGELPDLALPAASFDVITAFHVVEHLRQPAAYLREARRLLREDGLLVVEVPNYACAGFRFLGTRDLCFDYPHHLLFFTPETLGALLAEAGFRVESVSHFSLEYSPFTTLQNLLNALPGSPNRFYRALMRNGEARALRAEPLTWLHGLLAVLLAGPALALALAGLVLPVGNTIRFYCRPAAPGA